MPYAAALSPRTSLRVRSTEDEDSPKGYRSPKPATPSGGVGRKALFAGDGSQSGFFDSLKEASSDASFLHFRIFVKVSERALPEIRESDIIGVS